MINYVNSANFATFTVFVINNSVDLVLHSFCVLSLLILLLVIQVKMTMLAINNVDCLTETNYAIISEGENIELALSHCYNFRVVLLDAICSVIDCVLLYQSDWFLFFLDTYENHYRAIGCSKRNNLFKSITNNTN